MAAAGDTPVGPNEVALDFYLASTSLLLGMPAVKPDRCEPQALTHLVMLTVRPRAAARQAPAACACACWWLCRYTWRSALLMKRFSRSSEGLRWVCCRRRRSGARSLRALLAASPGTCATGRRTCAPTPRGCCTRMHRRQSKLTTSSALRCMTLTCWRRWWRQSPRTRCCALTWLREKTRPWCTVSSSTA